MLEDLLSAKKIRQAEQVYLMPTNSAGYDQQLGFQEGTSQQLQARRQ